MPARKTLGKNVGKAGGMLSAMGLAPAPKAAEAQVSAPRTPAARANPKPAKTRPERQPTPPPPARAPSAPAPQERPSPELAEPTPPAAEPLVRLATDISASALRLAKQAAHWNRETLRNFVERAIEAEARRVADEHGLDSLPPTPPLRRGRPLQP